MAVVVMMMMVMAVNYNHNLRLRYISIATQKTIANPSKIVFIAYCGALLDSL